MEFYQTHPETRNRRIPSKFKSREANYVFNTMRRELKIGVFNVVEHARVQENVQTLRSAGKYYCVSRD